MSFSNHFNGDTLKKLKENVKEQMKRKNMKQVDLAEKLGTQQSNISKFLSDKTESCCSVEQLVNMSKIFGVSVDTLLGNEQAPCGLDRDSLNIREVCSVLAWLIRENYLTFDKRVLVDEGEYSESRPLNIDGRKYRELYFCNKDTVYKEDIDEETGENTGTYHQEINANFYHTFHFSNYEKPGLFVSRQEVEAAEEFYEAFGNDNTDNIKINNFLQTYLDVYKAYYQGSMEKETLKNVEKALLDGLGDDFLNPL